MARKKTSETIRCTHYSWIIYRRNEKIYADGRGNNPSLGRHSLGTDDIFEARKKIVRLDQVMAVRYGLLSRSALESETAIPLSLAEGRRIYEAHLARPEVAGGPCAKTRARYRAVFDKVIDFLEARGITFWNAVSTEVIEHYLSHLEKMGYEQATIYLEGTFIKQVIKFHVRSGKLPDLCNVSLKLRKPSGTSTYCYTHEQFRVMLDHCARTVELKWLFNVILGLGLTGMRIGELASLRWTDVDFSKGMIALTNDPHRVNSSEHIRRRTKNRRDRFLPIQADLRPVLETMPRHAHGHVFGGPKGGKLDPDMVRCAFVEHVITPLAARYPALGGIGFSDGRLHSFRHFFCSWASSRGIAERVVKAWLGHHDSRMVDRYYHLHDVESQTQMQKLKLADGLLGDVARNPPAA